MAIDFMIMPMSRYVSGDFITPAMKYGWEQGIAYWVLNRGARRECPPGLPFGGADASDRRARFLPMLQDDLTKLPAAVGQQLWDEASQVEPRFHRVDPASYQSLLEQAHKKRNRPSFLDLFKLKPSTPPHTTATLFLPCEFGDVFAMTSPFERNTGSAKRALRELSGTWWSSETASARETLTNALNDVCELHLPMIVDS